MAQIVICVQEQVLQAILRWLRLSETDARAGPGWAKTEDQLLRFISAASGAGMTSLYTPSHPNIRLGLELLTLSCVRMQRHRSEPSRSWKGPHLSLREYGYTMCYGLGYTTSRIPASYTLHPLSTHRFRRAPISQPALAS